MKSVAIVVALLVFCMITFIYLVTTHTGGHAPRALAGTQISTLSQHLEMYNLNIGHYPTETEGGLKALVVKPRYSDPSPEDKWKGPYIAEESLKDPWGTDYHYRLAPGADLVPFKLWSNGPDRKDGTDDDIRNW